MFLSHPSRRKVAAFILILCCLFSNLFLVPTFSHEEYTNTSQVKPNFSTTPEFTVLQPKLGSKASIEITPYRDKVSPSTTLVSPVVNNSHSTETPYSNLSHLTTKLNYRSFEQSLRSAPVRKLPIIFVNPETELNTDILPSITTPPTITPPPAVIIPIITPPILPPTQLQKLGRWSDPQAMSVVGIQASTLPNGKILLFDGSEGVGAGDARTLNYETYDTTEKKITKSMATTPLGDLLKYSAFCAAMLVLPNGNLFLAGGDVQGDAVGTKKSGVFNIVNDTWSLLKQMSFPRWYPSAIQTLSDQILVVGGTQDSYTNPATTPELYNIATNTWRQLIGADDTNDQAYGGIGHFYPWLYNLKNGNVANLGPRPTISIINTENEGSITNFAPRDLYDNNKILSARMQSYGSVARFSTNEVLFTGGGNDELDTNKSKLRPDSTDLFGISPVETANIIKLDELLKSPPTINGRDPLFTQRTGNPKAPRSNATLVIMADGKIMLTGGTSMNESANRNAQYDNAVLTPEIWDKTTGLWTGLANYKTHRIYHSIALLQKDATVFQAGGSGFNGQCIAPRGENKITVKGVNACKQYEIYQPGYLFDGSGDLKNRPNITSSQPSNLIPSSNFNITSNQNISKVTFVKAGNVTHSTNIQQYFMDTVIKTNGNKANITLPDSYFAAPKGMYFMFVWDKDGTPSIAQEIDIN
ncbi:MAG: DUF1929 domain-containing protein [candidate division SR1 bacterium]|nr:DUF1929 domain-containing protein [candidate division SR1 bacterium]